MERNHGYVEVYMHFETHTYESGYPIGPIKEEWKWQPVLSLDFLGSDYTIANEVFEKAGEEFGNKFKLKYPDDMPKDSSVWFYKHDYNWMDALFMTVIPGTIVLNRLRNLIAQSDISDEDKSTWFALEEILEYYCDGWKEEQVEGKEHFVRVIFWTA